MLLLALHLLYLLARVLGLSLVANPLLLSRLLSLLILARAVVLSLPGARLLLLPRWLQLSPRCPRVANRRRWHGWLSRQSRRTVLVSRADG